MGELAVADASRISAQRELYAVGLVMRARNIIRKAWEDEFAPAILPRKVSYILDTSVQIFGKTYMKIKTCWISSSRLIPLLMCACNMSCMGSD